MDSTLSNAMLDGLAAKSLDELSFWRPIAEQGYRGFSASNYRQAAIHYKQYGLLSIGRDIGDLEGKTVIELCNGPTPIVAHSPASRAIGVDPLNEVYAQLWDVGSDGVDYVTSEIETFDWPEQVDVVICWNGIDHVRDLEATIAKIGRLCKPQGELWTFTNLEDRNTSIDVRQCEDIGHQHQFFFNPVSLDRFFASHGYRWATKSQYQPIKGKVYPLAGQGGVLVKDESVRARPRWKDRVRLGCWRWFAWLRWRGML